MKDSRSSDQKGNGNKKYDLEERTFRFASRVRGFTKRLYRTIENVEDVKQLVRSSGSVGANYIEANESLSKKDFLLRIKICRKEAKEARYFLRLIDIGNRIDGQQSSLEEEHDWLVNEATELMKIFGTIISKS